MLAFRILTLAMTERVCSALGVVLSRGVLLKKNAEAVLEFGAARHLIYSVDLLGVL